MNHCVRTSKDHGNGIVHGGAGDEDGVACAIKVNGAGAEGGRGIDNDYYGVSDRCVSNGVRAR